ncbi:MAG: hypothetical protein KZQ82_05505 [Candidatus Thiodiazotropha sp. (ex Lucinoma annulata)]|nr:hypothetical protein [Candidatus Thiodiazotropha sp. (ex Troendleina suluensis)]MCU7867211.1 hypothetical protein [Candidatus Thiodiazotropha sp. (ex Lucinoma borealis)]MCU7883638.1 hypothetical protein [Candidatus Thiodiazotropha sp. (ex Lucinoma annulata)]
MTILFPYEQQISLGSMTNMATVNPTGLRVPDQISPVGTPFFLDDKRVAAWARELPVANVGETSRLLFQTLREFNRTRIASVKRINSAEKLREPMNYVASNLNKHYLGIRFPLREKAHKIAILNRELHSGMATAYKAAIIDLVMESQGVPDLPHLTLAIHRCISYLSRVILQSVVVYDPYPKRTWRELHILHRLASRYEIGSKTVEDSFEPNGKKSSIDEIYCRCLLFSLASPYKLRQKENIQVFDTLLEWSRYALFYTYENAPEDFSITIRQDTDLAPSHEPKIHDTDSKYLLILDASPLLSSLREQFNDTPEKHHSLFGIDELDKGLIRQLIMLWSKAQKRAFVRTKLNFELRIAVGLRSVYKLITLGDRPSSIDDKDADDGTWIETQFAHGNELHVSQHFSLMPMDVAAYNPRRGDFEEFGPNSTEYGESNPEPEVKIWEDDKKKQVDTSTNVFKTINESAGGYCLDWIGKQIPKIQVGELIGVQSAMSATQFGVGMVRWMRSSDKESMQVGIQMIAPNALAVTAKSADIKDSKNEECLLLPEVGTSGQPTSFICPSYPFSLGKILLINDGENSREIKLTRLLESSGSISQFQFIYIDQQSPPKSYNDGENLDDDSGFDSLWSNLT